MTGDNRILYKPFRRNALGIETICCVDVDSEDELICCKFYPRYGTSAMLKKVIGDDLYNRMQQKRDDMGYANSYETLEIQDKDFILSDVENTITLLIEDAHPDVYARHTTVVDMIKDLKGTYPDLSILIEKEIAYGTDFF